MRTIFELTIINSVPLQNITGSAGYFALVFISVTLRKKVTTLTAYCWAFFLDIA